MKSILNLCLVGFIALFLAACGGTKVMNVDNNGYLQDSKLTVSQVEEAIKKGAARKGWTTRKISEGLIEAKTNVRGKHTVVVDIRYSTKGYAINYKDSENLEYDASSNTIHKNYNSWVSNLERNINYELSLVGTGVSNDIPSNVTYIQPKYIAPIPTTEAQTSDKYKATNSELDISGKIIYIKTVTPYSKMAPIAANIKAECTLDKQLAEFVQSFSNQNGVNVKYKDSPSADDIFLDLEITNAISAGGAMRGHSKYVTISGVLVKNGKAYQSFKAARHSAGGFWGAYKSSCSVLDRTVETLGKDTASWLISPVNGAKIGNTELIPF